MVARPSGSRYFLAVIFFALISCNSTPEFGGWSQYKGSNEGIHYSSLTQVDTSNVSQLKPAWEYHTMDADTGSQSSIQCNPIIVEDILYAVSPKLKLFALGASSGKEKWHFNPFGDEKKKGNNLNSCRGVTWFEDASGNQRIFFTAGSSLYSINAKTGVPDSSFGKEGKVDLHEGLGRDVTNLYVTSTSPGIIFRDLLIVGTRVNEANPAAPGHIRAYDTKTGKIRWTFHTVPQPGEKGYETWDDPQAYTFTGGANVWSGFSLDEKGGTVFAGTGSASFDFYGGKRTGNNLFANCVLALDAATGILKWHYQVIHHDVWDRDIPGAPVLVTVNKKEAVAITTKHGFVFVLDRDSGKPVYPVEEKPVPTVSDLQGEKLSATQPIPSKPAPFIRQRFTEKDINPLLTAKDRADVKSRWSGYLKDNMWSPPSLGGTVFLPGMDGGAEWGGPGYDRETGILYVNANEMAWIVQVVPIPQKQETNENNRQAGERLYQLNCMQCHGKTKNGGGNVPSLLPVKTTYTPGGFDSLLISGRRMMPAFRHLNKTERSAIAAVILNQKSVQQSAYIDTIRKTDQNANPYTTTGYNKFLTTGGLPALSPPWGTLNAINLNTGQLVWKKPLGTDPAFPQSKEQTGTENYGAPVITAGGLLFIAATKDGKIRGFNKRTGDLLWEAVLPAAGFATPSVYESGGKQFLVIACGGGKLGTHSGDSFMAFALP